MIWYAYFHFKVEFQSCFPKPKQNSICNLNSVWITISTKDFFTEASWYQWPRHVKLGQYRTGICGMLIPRKSCREHTLVCLMCISMTLDQMHIPLMKFSSNFKTDYNTFTYIFFHINAITTNFCTYQDSCAVLVCAKFCYDWMSHL